MTLLFVTQKIDAEDPVLGFVGDWVRALSARIGDVSVVANGVGSIPPDLGSEVISLGKERGRGRVARGIEYQRIVAGRMRGGGADALLAHMCPEYLNLAAPILRFRRTPGLLWFAHPSVTPSLRIADRLASAVLTSLPGAYPLGGRKVRVIGQAVDVDAFGFAPRSRGEPLRLVAVGRTSPSKGFPTIIRGVAAARRAGVEAQLRIVGPSTTPAEVGHRHGLAELIRDLLGDAGTLEDAVPHRVVAGVIGGGDVLVNAMVAGSGDKVVFEAAALGRPVLASNPSFADLLRDLPLALRFPAGDHVSLARAIGELAAADATDWSVTVKELRARVERDHSLTHWAHEVAESVGARR